VIKTVVGDDPAGQCDRGGRSFNAIDTRCACLGGEETKDPGSGTDIEHDITGPNCRGNARTKRAGTNVIANHATVDIDAVIELH
jgi:hypothetical protein